MNKLQRAVAGAFADHVDTFPTLRSISFMPEVNALANFGLLSLREHLHTKLRKVSTPSTRVLLALTGWLSRTTVSSWLIVGNTTW